MAVAHSADPMISIGVSSCLLGEQVRYDGGHKHDPYVAGTLARHFQLVPVCPELAIGMGVPRPPIRLIGEPAAPRAVGVRHPELDVTDRLAEHGRYMGGQLGHLSGYVFKSKSPSCGLWRVKVYHPDGPLRGTGTGIYAQALRAALPLLPVEEEGRLNDAVLRENFIERIYAYHHWQQLTIECITTAHLVAFHTAYKLTLMAHGKERARELGRLIAQLEARPLQELAPLYAQKFMQALAYPATRKRHTDTLFHLAGYLKKQLDGEDKAELVAVIEDYRLGRASLEAPLTLLRHHFRRHPHAYVARQVYLYPRRNYPDVIAPDA